MANLTHFDDMSMLMTPLVQWFRENLLHPIGFMQIGVIVVSYLIAWLFAVKIHQYFEKDIEKVKAHVRFVLSPAHFAIVLKYFFWLLLVWFFHGLFTKLKMPAGLLHVTLSLVVALLVIRFASFYIKSIFWSRFVYVICLLGISLRLFKLWDPTVHLLDSMTIALGKISISLGGLIEAIIVFVLLWIVAGVVNRFIGHWLTTSTHLTYSDRTLIQRVIKALTAALVIMIALSAAGIHPAAIAVTGGAMGFAVGIGLQKIGSNLVSGIMLLLRKPIRQGDVIAFE